MYLGLAEVFSVAEAAGVVSVHFSFMYFAAGEADEDGPYSSESAEKLLTKQSVE